MSTSLLALAGSVAVLSLTAAGVAAYFVLAGFVSRRRLLHFWHFGGYLALIAAAALVVATTANPLSLTGRTPHLALAMSALQAGFMFSGLALMAITRRASLALVWHHIVCGTIYAWFVLSGNVPRIAVLVCLVQMTGLAFYPLRIVETSARPRPLLRVVLASLDLFLMLTVRTIGLPVLLLLQMRVELSSASLDLVRMAILVFVLVCTSIWHPIWLLRAWRSFSVALSSFQLETAARLEGSGMSRLGGSDQVSARQT
jgi:hypothetical protein